MLGRVQKLANWAGTREVKVGTRTPPSLEAIVSAAAVKACGEKAPESSAGSRPGTIERTSTCSPAT